jgi:hypothetical protein
MMQFLGSGGVQTGHEERRSRPVGRRLRRNGGRGESLMVLVTCEEEWEEGGAGRVNEVRWSRRWGKLW